MNQKIRDYSRKKWDAHGNAPVRKKISEETLLRYSFEKNLSLQVHINDQEGSFSP